MYKLIIKGDVVQGDLLVIDKVAGKTVHVSKVDTGQPQVRTGPKWKDVKPPKPVRPEKPGKPDKGKK